MYQTVFVAVFFAVITYAKQVIQKTHKPVIHNALLSDTLANVLFLKSHCQGHENHTRQKKRKIGAKKVKFLNIFYPIPVESFKMLMRMLGLLLRTIGDCIVINLVLNKLKWYLFRRNAPTYES